MTNRIDSSRSGLDITSQRLLRELLVDADPLLIDPADKERRAAAIELASNGHARLVSFERKIWELHPAGW